jgi:zinc/manganese transport system substrate-binding protein
MKIPTNRRALRGAGAAMLAAAIAALMLTVAGCGSDGPDAGSGGAVIAVTTPILGAVVKDAVGDAATVEVIMPNGADPHEWRPSAKDVARLEGADLIVQNGLGLEGGLTSAIAQAREGGVPVFTATDHVDVRTVKAGEGADPSDADQAPGAKDPHFWTDPTQMRAVVEALPAAVKSATGTDIATPSAATAARLTSLDDRARAQLDAVPTSARGIVTGHESLGYLARRYNYRVVGAITPSLSSQGQLSAAHLAALEAAMKAAGVRVVFTEQGTSPQVASAIADSTGATVVELATEALPADGSYVTYIDGISRRIASALANTGGR